MRSPYSAIAELLALGPNSSPHDFVEAWETYTGHDLARVVLAGRLSLHDLGLVIVVLGDSLAIVMPHADPGSLATIRSVGTQFMVHGSIRPDTTHLEEMHRKSLTEGFDIGMDVTRVDLLMALIKRGFVSQKKKPRDEVTA